MSWRIARVEGFMVWGRATSTLTRLRPSLRRITEGIVRLSLTQKLILLALLVGLITGWASVLFQWLIRFVWELCYGADGGMAFPARRWFVLFIPAVGGLLVGPMVTFFAREARGHGVPEVMFAVARKGGRIRPIVALVKAVASSICIGTGGSAGKEGPIVQIGSAFGSTVGQLFRMSGGMTRMLVACGAAGGIAATFGTPIAGVLFALEVILQEFAAGAFSMVVIASVTASAVAKLLLNEGFFFRVPEYAQRSHWELFLYAAMGIVAALYARLFVRVLYGTEDLFDALRMPEWLKPALGGLCLGALAFFFPQVLGTSHTLTELAIWGQLSIVMLVVLSFAKILATSFTLGSGGSGGVFSPSLFIGAMMGGWLGHAFGGLFPSVVGSPGAYALVGMGAVFAAATRAPITAILIVFEMTGDYKIILPMMIAVVAATIVAAWISDETIYTLKLLRRDIRLGALGGDALAMTSVREVMTREVEHVPQRLTLAALLERLHVSPHRGFPVVDEAGALVGLLASDQIQAAFPLLAEVGEVAIVADVMLSPPPVVLPDDTLAQAAEKMGLSDVDRLPVVHPDDSRRLVGFITHSDILDAYRGRGSASARGPLGISHLAHEWGTGI
jgi:chloride channel protein, CIC family